MKNKELKNIQQIIQCTESIFAYLNTNNIKTQEQFENNTMLSEACIFNLAQIGEKVNNISEDTQQEFKHIPWVQIKGLRNKIVHDYFGINMSVIWKTIQNDLPGLNKHMQNIENELKKELGINYSKLAGSQDRIKGTPNFCATLIQKLSIKK